MNKKYEQLAFFISLNNFSNEKAFSFKVKKLLDFFMDDN
jgi:hypothetical protein